jgi:hypothetical protein
MTTARSIEPTLRILNETIGELKAKHASAPWTKIIFLVGVREGIKLGRKIAIGECPPDSGGHELVKIWKDMYSRRGFDNDETIPVDYWNLG